VSNPARRNAAVEAAIGHEFGRPGLLAEALTHASAAPAAGASYERVEFLGDRVLGLVIADLLIRRFPAEPEGDLARRHASLVSRETLVAIGRELDLAKHLSIQPAPAVGRVPESVLADACEAIMGAVYLDGGLDAAAKVIERLWAPRVDMNAPPPRDAKTELQEWVQARGIPLPVYRTVAADGPSHDPAFTVEALVETLPPARAVARSKRAAEQEAARTLLIEVKKRER
jgi:ribonuclease-3